MNINIEETEDIKVCVNETCLIFMRYNYKTAKLSFNMNGPLTIELSGEGKCDRRVLHDDNEEISLMLLNSLVDEVNFKRENDIITSVTLIKRI